MAKTVIDSLIVTLGLDPAGFKKGTAESERASKKFQDAVRGQDKKRKEDERKTEQERAKAAKETQNRQKAELDGVRKLRNETLAFLSIFTAGKGLLSFAKDTITSQVALAKLSENIDMGINEVGGWQVAMQKIGGSSEQASGMLDKAAMSVAAFRAGMPDTGVSGLFTAAGGTGVNLEGAFKDTRSFLLAQADVISALSKRDSKDAMLKARQMMGVDTETFNLLKQGREAVMRQVDAGAKAAGMNRGNAEASQRALREWVDMTTKLESVGRKILFAFLKPLSAWLDKNGPQITKMVDELANALSNIDPSAIQQAADAFMYMAKAIGIAVEGLAKFVDLAGTSIGAGAGWVAGLTGGGADDAAAAANRAQLEEIKKKYAAGAMAGPRGAAARAGSTAVMVGTVTVNTAATDAHGVAKDMNKALTHRLNPLVRQANTGMP